VVQENSKDDRSPESRHQAAAADAILGDAGQSNAEIETLRGELEESKSRSLRAMADLENYRRRVHREMDDLRRYANVQLLRDLLPVLDNLERALEAAEKAGESAGLIQGVKMVVQQIQATFQQHGCVRIEALGTAFDPNLHEAVLQQPSLEHPPGTVIHVVRSGFRLHDRVVRPSQVIVAAAPTVGPNGAGNPS
jgi:molecular chaperone GrpE